ncbi:UNVERIFIED_CONTAM: hypothetical protein PYX00_010105 [Menopon gallinae]|uniref:Uncharacterized protein n=1 Tax=Menopon gallinae TaxID=328185 RepID=A0AAW2HEC4_9NEOP
MVTINVPTIARNADASGRKRTENEGYVKLRNPEVNFKEYKQKKQSNSLDNISDSIQSLLGCTSAYNFCQSRRNVGNGRKNYEREAANSELEPLFFVGDKELYYNNDDISDSKIVVHHYPKYAEEGRPKDTLPEELRPKRYTRSSFKKQKVSLYNEKELDLYMKVPIIENKPPKMENKATETDKPKSSSSSSRDTAEMKRKTFLRKISLQDTYLNYNQDYWLDFRKSVRFHKSIDLGYFGDEENRKAETVVERPKPKLSERITEKSSEVIDEIDIGRQPPVPYESGRRTPNSGSTESWGRSAPTLADFRKAGPAKNLFLLPSSENIPLFCERNGNIETDFDVFGDAPEEECLLIEKADPVVATGREVRFGDSSDSGEHSYDPRPDSYDLNHKYDFSQFYEIKLNSEADPVRRSTVFNFQGGHAFFGENLNSTSDDSDVFYNETENGEAPDRTYPGRIMFSEKPRNSGMV